MSCHLNCSVTMVTFYHVLHQYRYPGHRCTCTCHLGLLAYQCAEEFCICKPPDTHLPHTYRHTYSHTPSHTSSHINVPHTLTPSYIPSHPPTYPHTHTLAPSHTSSLTHPHSYTHPHINPPPHTPSIPHLSGVVVTVRKCRGRGDMVSTNLCMVCGV